MTSITATLTSGTARAEGAAARPRGREQSAARRERRAQDLVLVDGILRGDDDAFRRLVERYQRPLYWVAFDVLMDGDEARDVVQETFIRVHGALDRFDRRRDLMNWMFRIARNLAIDHFRRRRRRAIPVEDPGAAADADLPGRPAPHPEHPDPELADQVAAVLADLPVEYRLSLTLREFHGLAPREIARVTDCSYPTARWRLHRARKLFREAWEARFGAAPVLEEGHA
jgi:RNA polymerase sigma-70 factor (ECF subfamily)